MVNKAFGSADAGLQKRLTKDKATIKMAVSDIFNSMHWRGISNFGGLYMDARGEAGKAVSLNSVLLTGLAVKKLKAGVTEILVVMK